MSVEMTPVTSSNIAAVGHDPEAGELHITFKSGETYVYSGLDETAYQDLLGAASPGSYFHRHIKGGGYSFRRA